MEYENNVAILGFFMLTGSVAFWGAFVWTRSERHLSAALSLSGLWSVIGGIVALRLPGVSAVLNLLLGRDGAHILHLVAAIVALGAILVFLTESGRLPPDLGEPRDGRASRLRRRMRLLKGLFGVGVVLSYCMVAVLLLVSDDKTADLLTALPHDGMIWIGSLLWALRLVLLLAGFVVAYLQAVQYIWLTSARRDNDA